MLDFVVLNQMLYSDKSGDTEGYCDVGWTVLCPLIWNGEKTVIKLGECVGLQFQPSKIRFKLYACDGSPMELRAITI